MWRGSVIVLGVGMCVGCGCAGGDALVEMAAADALDAISAQTRLALDEYHADLSQADDEREGGAIAAFVQRAGRDGDNAERMSKHSREFAAALAKLRGDRQTAWERHYRARDNIDRADEIADGLRRLARQSVSLSDEWDRHLGRLIEARRKVSSTPR